MSRADLKAKTLEAVDAQNKQDENGGYSKGYEHPAGDRGYLNLERDSLAIIRVMLGGTTEETYGQPLSEKGHFVGGRTTQKNPGENILLHKAWLRNDSGKNQPVTLPSSLEERNSHVLYKAIKALGAYTYDENAIDPRTNQKGVKTYKYSNEAIGKRVIFNGEPDAKYPSSMLDELKSRVMVNVIDRLDPDFHKEFKLTKVLIDGAYTSKKGEYVTGDPCIKLTTYSSLVSFMKKESKILDEDDIVIERYSKDSSPDGKKFYDFYYANDDIKKSWNPGEKENPGNGKYTKMVRGAEFAFDTHPDDKALQLIDLTKFVEVTPYRTIKKGFQKLISEADRLTGTKLMDELDKLVAEEAAKKGEAADVHEDETESIPETEQAPSVEKTEETKPSEPTVSRRVRSSEESSKEATKPEVYEVSFDEFKALNTAYAGINSLDETDRKAVIFYSDGTLVMIDDKKAIIEAGSRNLEPCVNTACDFSPSVFLLNCPKCGTKQG